jgi:hypothetical protein
VELIPQSREQTWLEREVPVIPKLLCEEIISTAEKKRGCVPVYCTQRRFETILSGTMAEARA